MATPPADVGCPDDLSRPTLRSPKMDSAAPSLEKAAAAPDIPTLRSSKADSAAAGDDCGAQQLSRPILRCPKTDDGGDDAVHCRRGLKAGQTAAPVLRLGQLRLNGRYQRLVV